jgi:CBS-domain-containing membrane protein
MSEVSTTRPDEDLAALIQRIGSGLDQRVLVFENGRLVGIVSPVDVARLLAVRQQLGGGTRSPGAAPGSS